MIFLNDNIPSQTTMRGVTRYFQAITAGLIERFGARLTVYSPVAGDYHPAHFQKALRFRGIRRLGLHDALAARAARRAQPALVYCAYFGTLHTTAPQIYTLYDTLTEEAARAADPHGWRQWRYVRETRLCLERAHAVLAISQSAMRDVLALYPHLPAEKFTVTPLGVAPFFFEGQPAPADPPYFLYVGERAGHKNFLGLLQAFAHSDLARRYRLRVHSRHTTWTSAEAALIQQHQLGAAVQLQPPLGEAELRTAYASATALVYPSLQEGFGLPILEAMASGTLVATSGRSAMPEAGGEAAFYFDPEQPATIAAALGQIAALSEMDRRARREQGRRHALTFTWRRCQEQTAGVFEAALGAP